MSGLAPPLDARRANEAASPGAATATAPPGDADAGYYVRNFEIVLELAERRYADLLDEAETAFLTAVRGLSESARRLYVRLVSRLGPCFRRDALAYPEIPRLDVAARELEAAGLLDRGEDEGTETLLALLRKAELLELAAARLGGGGVAPSQRRQEVLDALLERVPHAALRADVHRRIEVLRPLATEQVRTFRLLFFGNLRQDWSELVLQHLGLFRYEPYEVRFEHRLFPDRRALDDTLEVLEARREIRRHLEAEDDATALESAERLRDRPWHPVAAPHADELLVRLGRHLERRGALEEALRFYRSSETPPSRERQARILARRGREAAALRLVGDIARRPRDESERRFAECFEPRLRRRFGLPVGMRSRPLRPTATLRLAHRPERAVEAAVLDTLAAEGRAGFFSENWLWRSLFGLAFWDVVFAPVPGVFQHPFQAAPLDLFSRSFRERRRDLVTERLAELAADPRPGPGLRRRYREKHGTRNRLVDWSPQRRPLLDAALGVLGGEHLAVVCNRLSEDPARFRRGLPDLFVLRREAPGFELLEVKAPGDQLRPEQEGWIDHLNRHGLPARILQVSWGRS